MWEIRTDSLHARGRQQLSSKCVSLSQNTGDLVSLGKEKLLNKRHGGNNSYFETQKNDNLSPQINSIAKNSINKKSN